MKPDLQQTLGATPNAAGTGTGTGASQGT